MSHCVLNCRRRTAEFAVALAVPTEGPKILGCTKNIHNRLFDETCFASNSAKIGGGTGDAIAPRTPGSGGLLAETCDSCTAVCTALPSAAAAVTLAKKLSQFQNFFLFIPL